MLHEHGAIHLHMAGRPRSDRRSTGLDAGAKHRALWLAGLWLCGGRHRAVFCGTDVHASGGVSHRVQHPQAGRRPCAESAAGLLSMPMRPGLIRNRLDAAAADTETLLAHNLADIVGTITLFLSMLVLMFVFDWRMGAACLLAAVISILAMFSMMGGKNAGIMAEYQAAQDRMSKAGTEYVRGIPVVKVFQQTVVFVQGISSRPSRNTAQRPSTTSADVCRVPQSVNLTFTEGAFVFMVPAALFLAPSGAGRRRLLPVLSPTLPFTRCFPRSSPRRWPRSCLPRPA